MDEFWTFPPFGSFQSIAPDSTVFVADIEGSTRRFAATGEYRDMTFLATAALVAAENHGGEVGGVFTGDGCILVARPDQAAAVGQGLAAVAGWAAANLGLTLRVAGIPATVLDGPLLVATTQLDTMRQWHMLGRGTQSADRLAKEAADFRIAPAPDASPNLTGLSCRWDPLRTARGTLVSLLVQSTVTDPEESHRTLTGVFQTAALLAAPVAQLWPVRREVLRFSWPPRGIVLETKAVAPRPGLQRRLAYLRLLVRTAATAVFLKSGLNAARDYMDSLGRNTVAAQINDGLAMIIDCTENQHQAIRAFLEQQRRAGRVRYGTFASEQAYMTCVVRSLKQHRHFLDATVGGYWHAAQEMKRQASVAAEPRPPH